VIHAFKAPINNLDMRAAQNLCKKAKVPLPRDFPTEVVIGIVDLTGVV
jgi:hypothetical protein